MRICKIAGTIAIALALSAWLSPPAFAGGDNLVMDSLVLSPNQSPNDWYESPCKNGNCGGHQPPENPHHPDRHPSLGDTIAGAMKLELDGSGRSWGDLTSSHDTLINAYTLDESVSQMVGDFTVTKDQAEGCLGCGDNVKSLSMMGSETHAIGIESLTTDAHLKPGETFWVDGNTGVWSGIKGGGFVTTFGGKKGSGSH